MIISTSPGIAIVYVPCFKHFRVKYNRCFSLAEQANPTGVAIQNPLKGEGKQQNAGAA